MVGADFFVLKCLTLESKRNSPTTCFGQLSEYTNVTSVAKIVEVTSCR
jgi:hypothetical protein